MEQVKNTYKAQVIKDLEIKASFREVRMSAKETPAWVVALLLICLLVIALAICI